MVQMIRELLNERQYKAVKNALDVMDAVSIADLFSELEDNELIYVFRLLSKDIAADVFSYLTSDQQMHIISSITDREINHIINELYFDDMIDLIEEMPANVVQKILKNTKEDERILINQFLNYPEYSAGSLMTIEYVSLKPNMTVSEALQRIKRTGLDKETVYTSYVTSSDRKLRGIVSLRKLVTSEDNEIIEDLMNDRFLSVNTHDDQEIVANIFKKYDLMSLPVIDNEGRLTGIITIDDIVDVIEQENTEDFQKMAGIQPTDIAYLDDSIFSMAKHRITWLLVLMVSATFTGQIIQRYEEVLQSVVLLAAFIPMLMDTGGNAGSQSSTMIIRGLALGDLKPRDVFKVLTKELSVAFMVGIALSVLNFLRIVYLQKVAVNIALTVTITLFLTILLAKAVGCVLPILASVLKVDPAVMAGPLITTIVDAVALVVYFSLAVFFLGI